MRNNVTRTVLGVCAIASLTLCTVTPAAYANEQEVDLSEVDSSALINPNATSFTSDAPGDSSDEAVAITADPSLLELHGIDHTTTLAAKPVPEPSVVASLSMLGLVGFAAYRRR